MAWHNHRPTQRRRRSIRLQGYDYAQTGAYFVTICTQDRECLFGEIVDMKMRLNERGKIVRDEWFKTAIMRPHVCLDENEFVVMPNHIHGIIWITVGATRWVAPAMSSASRTTHRRATHRVAPTGPPSGSIGAIIGQFKPITAKRINELRGTRGIPIWQRNYYEHIIRNDEELNRIRAYIADNPAQWAMDRENPDAVRAGHHSRAPLIL